MCLSPKTPKDNSAAIARQQEEERQGKIKQGQTAIDDTFKSFDDNYYGGISKNYSDYYNPQIDDQYKEALDKLTFQLGRQGILQSTAANDKFGKAKETYDTARTDVANRALNASQEAKSNVENQRNSLISLNTSSADPSLISSRASAAAAGLNTTPVYSPIGNVFAGLIDQGANQVALQQAGYPGLGLPLPKPKYSTDGTGTGSVVNG